jgi:hypothetical protein
MLFIVSLSSSAHCLKTAKATFSSSLENILQFSFSFVPLAIVKNIMIDFSLSHHFHFIIAAITFAHSKASSLALAIL